MARATPYHGYILGATHKLRTVTHKGDGTTESCVTLCYSERTGINKSVGKFLHGTVKKEKFTMRSGRTAQIQMSSATA